MFCRMNIVCRNGAVSNIITSASDARQGEDARDAPLVILYHDASLSSPKILHGTFLGDDSQQPLTAAAIKMVNNIGGLRFKGNTRPTWLPTELSASVPFELEDVYNDACKCPVDSIVFISPTADCNDFVQALRLLSSLPLSCAAELKKVLQKIGKISPPKSWKEELESLFNDQFKKDMQQLAKFFSDKGHPRALSPTGNGKKVDVVTKMLRLEDNKIWVRDSESGVGSQPDTHMMGILGNLTRAKDVLTAFRDTDGTSSDRPAVFSIESFMELGEEISKLLTVEPLFQVFVDFTVNSFFDTARAESVSVITKGTAGPKAVNDLRHLLQTGHTNGELLAAIFPYEKIDPKNWHKWVFPEEDRYFDIIEGCLADETLMAAISAWRECW